MRRQILIFVIVATTVLSPNAVLAGETPEGPVHIALGDSQAFGTGTPQPDKLGYSVFVNRWAHAINCGDGPPEACPGLEFANLTVPGAKSSDLIATQLGPALDLIADRNGDTDPSNDVVLITLTIGGNDLFRPVLDACSGGATPTCVATIQTLFTAYANNLALILGSLRAAAPEAQIVQSTYPNGAPTCFLAALSPLFELVLEGGPGLPVGFNDIIRSTAAAFDVGVADLWGQLDSDDWVGGQDCNHLDISGYHRIAEVFLAVIE
jgi:lysophospholipase L1-like esterase